MSKLIGIYKFIIIIITVIIYKFIMIWFLFPGNIFITKKNSNSFSKMHTLQTKFEKKSEVKSNQEV